MASWYEDLVKTLDLQPADVATLFAGARSAVPIYALLGATGLNEGEDAEIARRMGPRPASPPPPVPEEEQQRRMIEDFERQFPTPALRQAAIEHMRAVRAGRAYDPATATRRADFAPQAPGPVMKPVDSSIQRRRYASGGGVKKTVQQMADEMLLRGGKTAAKPDPARRSFLGLRPQSVMDMPIARLDDAGLAKLERQYGKEGKAPTVTEQTTTVSPDAGRTKSTLKSVIETPVSRRTVLKSAAGQAMQGVLPKGALPSVADVAALPVESVAQSLAPTIPIMTEAMIPGMVAQGIQSGLPFSRIMRSIRGELGTGLKNLDETDIERIYENMMDPYSAAQGFEDAVRGTTPGQAWLSMTGADKAFGTSTGKLRESMRAVKEADPELYETLRTLSRDVSEYGYEY